MGERGMGLACGQVNKSISLKKWCRVSGTADIDSLSSVVERGAGEGYL
jgi:hypothetical protein